MPKFYKIVFNTGTELVGIRRLEMERAQYKEIDNFCPIHHHRLNRPLILGKYKWRWDHVGAGEISYTPGEWTYPREGFNQFLFVYSSLEDAKGHLSWMPSGAKLYECEVKGPAFSKRDIEGYPVYAIGCHGDSTILVDALKLTIDSL